MIYEYRMSYLNKDNELIVYDVERRDIAEKALKEIQIGIEGASHARIERREVRYSDWSIFSPGQICSQERFK